MKQKKSSPPRLQLNIRLTPELDELIKQRMQQTHKNKTQFIVDCITQTPIYAIPNLQEALSSIKYLGNKTNELSQKLDMNDQKSKELIQTLQKECDILWQLLKSLRQEKPKQV